MELTDAVEKHFRISEVQKRAHRKLSIATIDDLLSHYPTRYENLGRTKTVATLAPGEAATLYGVLKGPKTRRAFRSKVPIAEGYLEDGSGKVKLIWFNQPYIAKMHPDGSFVKIAGKVGSGKSGVYFGNPEIEAAHINEAGTGPMFSDMSASSLYPIYPESRGITSKWFYYAIDRVLKSGILEKIVDPIPAEIIERYHLPTKAAALVWIHTPKTLRDSISAKKRFAFEEVFFIQVGKFKERREYEHHQSFKIALEQRDISEFTSRFSFPLTGAQKKSIENIVSDMKSGHPMSRLLEGDVGSGKTAVAAATAYATVMTRPAGQNFGNLQVAYMVPTEILAKQHFESFIALFKHLPINIGLLTSSGCKKFPSKVNREGATDISRAQLLRWVANGEIPILIGTHALIQKAVKFKNLAYVIIDEQHRFGTRERKKLVRKDDIAPHLLSMTATPIPRTLALTIYGDLDLSLLDEMPAGRKPIVTEIVAPSERESVYEKIRSELKAGRQAYVICPRIDEPDPTKELALLAKSVKKEAKRLADEVFPEFDVGILHSKMSASDKDSVMEQFAANKIQILVATSVVEVGVNVPNATVIVIEGAERFGLAQLHQLRGRVLRSTHQAYCYVFADSKGKQTTDRLRAIKTAKNGFELAEFDLKLRGAGELGGGRQWGISDIAMEAMSNLKMVEAARTEAEALVEEDPTLAKYPHVATKAAEASANLHFE